MSLTPAQRVLRARIAAHASWANCPDPRKRTAPARKGFVARFEDQVDPHRTLPPVERARRAEAAMRSHMAKLALKSSRARARGGADVGDREVAAYQRERAREIRGQLGEGK